MFLQKDIKSKFNFISTKEFCLALLIMLATTVFSFVVVPISLKKVLFAYKDFFNSHYFGIVMFFLSSILTSYIIYYFCCRRKNKTLQEGLFLNSVSTTTLLYIISIGSIMPLISLPVIFKFAPSAFYAMDIAKTKEGLIYLLLVLFLLRYLKKYFIGDLYFHFFRVN